MQKIESFFKNLAIIFIRIYQLVLSPIVGGECRFHPTCSAFAIEAFSNFSFLVALRLVLKRFFSCNGYSSLLNSALRSGK